MKGLLIQEFKTLFRSPAALSILIIPVVLMVGLGYLLPSGWIVPSAITIGIVGTVLLYFGGSIEEIKRTSFMKSISLTRLNKFTFLATKILFSVIVSLFSVLWVLFFGWFFTGPVDFLAKNFENLLPPSGGVIDIVRSLNFEVDWTNVNWIVMLYAGAITIIVSISIAFIFVAFSKSSLSFYLMSFGYLLAMILFGGVVMPSFLISEDNSWFKYLYYIIPNFYTNNVMADSFGNGLGATLGKVIKPNAIYLGQLLNLFGEPADKFLSQSENILGLNFKEINKAYNEMTPEQLISINNNISSFFEPDKYGVFGKVDSLTAPGTEANEYEKFVFTVLNLPSTIDPAHPYDSWHSMLKGLIKSGLGVPGFIAGGLAGELSSTVGDIITAIIKNPANIIESVSNVHINTELASYAPILPPELQPIVASLGKNWTVSKILDENAVLITSLLTKEIEGLSALLNYIGGMFGETSTIDYVVPWIETVVFLGISTKFFKWS